MSGLEIAAGAATLVSCCNFIVSKLVPFLHDCENVDQTLQRFHNDICQFKEVLVAVESNFGARADLKLERFSNRSRQRAIKQHMQQCTNTLEKIEKGLPPAQKGRSLAQKTRTNIYMLLGTETLKRCAKMCRL